MNKQSGFTWKLGMFVVIGLVVFIGTIYFVGKQKNLFGSTFEVSTRFQSVSGLKVGNNVRFSGINIGTVDGIELITDSSVRVRLVIRKEMQQFIKTDATASIGSDGLMGDKVMTITPGHESKNPVKDGGEIASKKAIDMEDVMASVKSSVDNAGIITAQLAQLSFKLNNGNGVLARLTTDEGFSNSLKSTLVNLETSSQEFAKFTTNMNDSKGALSKLISDEKFSNTLDSTMANLQTGTKSLSDNMEAAQNNILLKGFFKKKKKAEQKKLDEIKKQEELKKEELKKKTETQFKTAVLKDSTRSN